MDLSYKGRKSGGYTADQREAAIRLYETTNKTKAELARMFNVPYSTMNNWVQFARRQNPAYEGNNVPDAAPPVRNQEPIVINIDDSDDEEDDPPAVVANRRQRQRTPRRSGGNNEDFPQPGPSDPLAIDDEEEFQKESDRVSEEFKELLDELKERNLLTSPPPGPSGEKRRRSPDSTVQVPPAQQPPPPAQQRKRRLLNPVVVLNSDWQQMMEEPGPSSSTGGSNQPQPSGSFSETHSNANQSPSNRDVISPEWLELVRQSLRSNPILNRNLQLQNIEPQGNQPTAAIGGSPNPNAPQMQQPGQANQPGELNYVVDPSMVQYKQLLLLANMLRNDHLRRVGQPPVKIRRMTPDTSIHASTIVDTTLDQDAVVELERLERREFRVSPPQSPADTPPKRKRRKTETPPPPPPPRLEPVVPLQPLQHDNAIHDNVPIPPDHLTLQDWLLMQQQDIGERLMTGDYNDEESDEE